MRSASRGSMPRRMEGIGRGISRATTMRCWLLAVGCWLLDIADAKRIPVPSGEGILFDASPYDALDNRGRIVINYAPTDGKETMKLNLIAIIFILAIASRGVVCYC